MREPDWFDGPEDPDGQPRGRPRWFPLLIAVPWVVVVGLLVAPQLDRGVGDADVPQAGSDTAADTADAPAPAEEHRESAPAAAAPPPLARSQEPGAATPEVVEIREFRGQWRVAPGSEEAASLAVVVARAWLTGIGPTLALPGIAPDDGAYAEHLVVEAAERTSADTEVVTVLAITLREVDGATPSVAVERLAVPISWDDQGPRPAGEPWPLPGPRLDPVEPALVALDDDPAAWDRATSALADAGLGTYRLEALQEAPDGPVVATIADGTQQHDVWLRPHLGGYVVAGSTLAAASDGGPAAEGGP